MVVYSLNENETRYILSCIKKERQKLKGFYDPTLDALIKKFELGSKKYADKHNFEVSPRIKKARLEYEKIFFEKYGVKEI